MGVSGLGFPETVAAESDAVFVGEQRCDCRTEQASFFPWLALLTCGLYYKSFTIVMYTPNCGIIYWWC